MAQTGDRMMLQEERCLDPTDRCSTMVCIEDRSLPTQQFWCTALASSSTTNRSNLDIHLKYHYGTDTIHDVIETRFQLPLIKTGSEAIF